MKVEEIRRLGAELVDGGAIEALKKELAVFLEAHLKTRVLDLDGLQMFILLSKNQNTKIKDKFINYKLGEVSRMLLSEQGGKSRITLRDYIACEYLIEELKKYVANSLK